MSLIRLEAMKTLAEAFESTSANLVGRVFVGPLREGESYGHPPYIHIIPVRFDFEPMQESVHMDLGAGQIVSVVGNYEGTVQVRLVADSPEGRAELEDEVEDLFFREMGRPGVLVEQVGEAHDVVVAFELDDESWRDEFMAEDRIHSVMTVLAQVPAMVERGDVWGMDDVRLVQTEELTTEYGSLPAGSLETVRVLEDGTLTPVS